VWAHLAGVDKGDESGARELHKRLRFIPPSNGPLLRSQATRDYILNIHFPATIADLEALLPRQSHPLSNRHRLSASPHHLTPPALQHRGPFLTSPIPPTHLPYACPTVAAERNKRSVSRAPFASHIHTHTRYRSKRTHYTNKPHYWKWRMCWVDAETR
jgi:hypothetical protein